jgi:hypothetical protein
MDTAIKRERRAVQNTEDKDRVVGSGGVSKSMADAECRILASPTRSLPYPKHTSHAPTTHDTKYVFASPKVGSYRHVYTPAFRIFSDDVHGAM